MSEAYGATQHFTTPLGWDVCVALFPVGADEVPVVAVLGHRGYPTQGFAIKLAFSNAKDSQLAGVAAMAAMGALALGPEDIRWQVAEKGALVEDRKRAKKLVPAIHPEWLMKKALRAVAGEWRPNVDELLRQYRIEGKSDVAMVADSAELGFPPGMYGQPSSQARVQIGQRMARFGEQLRAQWLSGTETFGADLLKAEIDRSIGDADVDSLAAWVELLVQGKKSFHYFHRSLQRGSGRRGTALL